jgi:putative adhesin
MAEVPGVAVPPEPPRSGWLVTGLLLTVLVLALTTSGVWYWLGGSAPTYSTAEEQTYRHPIDKLVLDLNLGMVTLIGTTGPGPDTVEVTRDYRFTQRHRPSASETWQGNALHVGPPRCVPDDNDCSADYTIRLPAGTAVDAATGAGDISTRGITADQRLQTGGGAVRVAGSGATLDIDSRGGDITGTRLAATDTVVSTEGGAINLDYLAVPSTLDATSDGGDVDVAVPRAGSGTDSYRVDTGGDGIKHELATVDVAQDPAGRHVLFIRANGGSARVHY